MTTEIKAWEITNNTLRPVESSLAIEGRTESLDLEEWISTNPEIIGSGLEIIGRQVTTKSGPLDLLAIDRTGDIIVIELKRDKLPRDVIAQAIDYASDIADWNIDKISEVCTKHTGKSLDDLISEKFPDVSIQNLNINEAQRIILVGFAIESSLERMINWLSDHYGVNINAIILKYIKTIQGDELLIRTAIISEEMEQSRTSKRKFTIPMSDEPGEYDEKELEKLFKEYLQQGLSSAKWMRKIILPACLEHGTVTRDQLKEEFIKHKEAEDLSKAGYHLTTISNQLGMANKDFLRQVIGYEYPNYEWEKNNYHIRDGYEDFVRRVLNEINVNE
jgi:hypothetical protein